MVRRVAVVVGLIGAVIVAAGISRSVPVPTTLAGPTLIVTSTGDASSCPGGSGNPGYTLRCAILQANVGSSTTIAFNIVSPPCASAPKVCVISPSSALPTLTAGGTQILGYTETASSQNSLAPTSGDNAAIAIQIDGKLAGGSGVNGLTVTGTGDKIEGLAITDFSGNGIQLGIPGGARLPDNG